METKVLESRVSHEGHSIRRRRSCLACNYRFTTYEKKEETVLQVRKKNDRFEDFDREKLFKSIQTACRKRPFTHEQIETLVAEIEAKLRAEDERVVPSQHIGDMVMEKLREVDQVAYVRFASIYKDFRDTDQFMNELQLLKSNRRFGTPPQPGH